MLFSNPGIVDFIHSSFEPCWQSVRDVPLVCVDFGDSEPVVRTVDGNIATYVCSAGGDVLDVIPGLYSPESYLESLRQLRRVAERVRQGGTRELGPYHKEQLAALGRRRSVRARPVNKAAGRKLEDTGKSLVESPVREMLKFGAGPAESLNYPTGLPKQLRTIWDALTRDSVRNENFRRRKIHAYLSEKRSIGPGELERWLYRDVLHTDLDDPYLGRGESLRRVPALENIGD